MLNRFFLVVLVGTVVPSVVAEAQTGIAWLDSVEAAKAQAAQSQRLVLLHFYSDDCGPCRRLDARVFPVPAVQASIQRGFVPAKINTSKDPQAAKLYNVYTWPTDIIVDARGRELYRTISPPDANQYTRMLDSMLASHHGTMPHDPRIDQSPMGGQSLLGAAPTDNNPGLYGQAATEQLRQTQQYSQHVANQYQGAAQNMFGQAQRAAAQGAQTRLTQAQQAAQLYGQGAQQTAQEAAGAAQSQLANAQQTAAQYGQNLGAYGQQAAQSVAGQAAAAQQSIQQTSRNVNQYGQQAMQSASNAMSNAAQAAGPPATQAAQNGLYAQQQPGSAPPYSPAYDPAQNARPQFTGGNGPVQAPPYGQLTHNPYVTQGQPATANVEPAVAAGAPAPPTVAASPMAPTAPTAPTTAPYGDLYANNANAAAAPSSQPTAPTTPPIAPAPDYEPNKPRPLGMDGYCPVTLMTTKKWAKGDARFGAVHRSRTYLFLSEAEQKQFMADPDRYAPMLSGYDAVSYRKTGRLVDGSRAHGLTFMNQMFLFESEESLAEFAKSPQVFLGVVQQAMQAAPHRAVR